MKGRSTAQCYMWHQHHSFTVSENSEVTSIPGGGLQQSQFETAHVCSEFEWCTDEIRQREKSSSLFPGSPHLGSVFAKLFIQLSFLYHPPNCVPIQIAGYFYLVYVFPTLEPAEVLIFIAKSSELSFPQRCLSELYWFTKSCFSLQGFLEGTYTFLKDLLLASDPYACSHAAKKHAGNWRVLQLSSAKEPQPAPRLELVGVSPCHCSQIWPSLLFSSQTELGAHHRICLKLSSWLLSISWPPESELLVTEKGSQFDLLWCQWHDFISAGSRDQFKSNFTAIHVPIARK